MKTMGRILYAVMKLFWIPVHLILRAALLVAMLISAVSGWIFRLVGTIFLVTTICYAGFGLGSKEEYVSMLVTSIGILLAPLVAETIIAVMEAVIQ